MEKETGSSLSSLKSQYLYKALCCRLRRRGGARAPTRPPAPSGSCMTYLAISNLRSRLAYIFGFPFRLECISMFSLALSVFPVWALALLLLLLLSVLPSVILTAPSTQPGPGVFPITLTLCSRQTRAQAPYSSPPPQPGRPGFSSYFR